MIQKLRYKFIIIAMSSVVIVIYSIIGIINGVNYFNIVNRMEPFMDSLIISEGEIPIKDRSNIKQGNEPFKQGDIPIEGGFFAAIINYQGEVTDIKIDNISAISKEEAINYAAKAYTKNRDRGFIGNFKYRLVEKGKDTLVVFLDYTRELTAFYSFLRASLIISTIGILLVLVLVVILSKIAVKPIAESYEKQKRFITDASHEIKTPLTIISANAEVLEMTTGENQWLKSIKGQIKRLTGLAESLVSLSKMDEKAKNIPVADFCLSEVLNSCGESFKALAEQEKKNLIVEIEDDISFKGDKELFRQLGNILLQNSIKYSDESGTIIFKLNKTNKTITISCHNTLDNIEIGNLDIVFERFYRRDASRSSILSGYGLGLSIAKEIVENHKGKISAKSEDGKTFTIQAVFKV